MVKCDVCQKTVKTTDNVAESYMGKRCDECNKQAKKQNWKYFDKFGM